MGRSRNTDFAAACAEWLAVAGLVTGAVVVLMSSPSPAGDTTVADEQPADVERDEPAHASATWPVHQRLGDTAGGSWCLVVEVLRSAAPGGDGPAER